MPKENTQPELSSGHGFVGYAGQRLILAIVLIGALVGGGAYLLDRFEVVPEGPSATEGKQPLMKSQGLPSSQKGESTAEQDHSDTVVQGKAVEEQPQVAHLDSVESLAGQLTEENPELDTAVTTHAQPTAQHLPQPAADDQSVAKSTAEHAPQPMLEKSEADSTAHQKSVTKPAQSVPRADDDHQQPTIQDEHKPKPDTAHPPLHAPKAKHTNRPTGVAFVEAVVYPIDHELNETFWGWEPNDLISITDNHENYQLGVLEVTRRTAVQLAERISRTGSTDAFNPHLQNAMNWFMVKGDRYWFPSPESKYKESLEELGEYKQQLIRGRASFYTRTDNLIPLLMAYEDLLGSCDENLVKHTEMDGSKVSTFKADDYFYYAKGVASAMVVILEAIHHDFAQTLDNRNGSELLHHAIESCKVAAEMEPLFVINSDLDGLFANHRANMAAPISHARFYIGQLIKTLST